MKVNSKISIQELIGCLDNLPTLPEIAMQVLKLSSDPNSNIEEFSALISRDSALAAKILRVANSSYYGFRNKISTLKTAIVMLGLEETVRLARAFTFLHSFPSARAGSLFDFNHFWLHNMTVAEIANGLAGHLKLPDPGLYGTGGLLHDMGVIVMASFFEDAFIEVINETMESDEKPLQIEERLFGMNHTQVGEKLAQRWNLPPELVTSIRYHHNPEESPEEMRMVAMVGYLANQLADYYGVSRLRVSTAPAKPAEDPVWQMLLESHPNAKPELLIENASLDVEKARAFHSTSMAAPAA